MKIINGLKAVYKYWNEDDINSISDESIKKFVDEKIKSNSIGKISSLFLFIIAMIYVMYFRNENDIANIIAIILLIISLTEFIKRRDNLYLYLLLRKVINNNEKIQNTK